MAAFPEELKTTSDTYTHRRAVLKTHLRASSDGSEMEGARPFLKRQRKIFCSSCDFFSQKQLREIRRRIRFAFSLRIPTILNFPAAYSSVTRGQVDGEFTFCALGSLKNFSHKVLDISENNFTKNKSDLFSIKHPSFPQALQMGFLGSSCVRYSLCDHWDTPPKPGPWRKTRSRTHTIREG